MFTTKKTPAEKTGLENAIDDVLAQMDHEPSACSEAYETLTKRLSELYALKEIDNKIEEPERVSKETIAMITAHLAGIVLIVGHERAHVVTSKALPLLKKLL